jgi:hypothetical protein
MGAEKQHPVLLFSLLPSPRLLQAQPGLSTRLRKIPDWLNDTTIRCLGASTNGTSPLNQQPWKISVWKSRGGGNEERQNCDDLHYGKFAEESLYTILDLGRSYWAPQGIVVESIEESKLRCVTIEV